MFFFQFKSFNFSFLFFFVFEKALFNKRNIDSFMKLGLDHSIEVENVEEREIDF